MKNFFAFFVALFAAVQLSAALTITAPQKNSEVFLHNKGQREYLAMSMAERRIKFADKKYRKTMQSYGFVPVPVKLQWKADGKARGPYTVLLSEKADFSKVQKAVTQQNEAAFTNLKIASVYYWKVTSANGESAQSSFRTADLAPRLIAVDKVPNVRDLGGRKGLDGKRVKQGMIYRSAGLNNNASPVYKPKSEVMKNPAVKALCDTAAADLKAMKSDKSKPVAPVPGNEWMVFALDREKLTPDTVMQYTKEFEKIPAALGGVRGKMMKTDSSGLIRLSGIAEHRLAVLMREFVSQEAGRMPVSCGADWYWVMIVNGKLVLNCLPGNLNSKYFCNDFEIPVRKGKNQMIVLFGSGTGGRQWQFEMPKNFSRKTANRNRKEMNKNVLRKIGSVIAGYKPGKSRVAGPSGEYMRNVLGIRSDIDLRSDRECYGMTGSPLGPSVTWFHYSSSAYGGMASKAGKAAFAKVFRVFLDPKNYPVDFHCIAGQDRTGAVGFILNGLLGVEENQLYLDWEATGFWNPSVSFSHKERFDHLTNVFKKLPGRNITEKCEVYVKSCGFGDGDIAQFRSIMLE